MKKTILFLLLFSVTYIFGQNNRLQLGLHGGTILSGLTNQFPITKENTYPHLGLQFGADALIPIKSEKLYFLSGIELTAYSDKYKSDNLRWGSQHNGQGGFDETASSPGLYLTSISHDLFLEIPIGIRFYLNGKKWRFFIQSSVDFAYYLKTRSKRTFINDDTDIPDETSISTYTSSSVLTVNYTGNLGFGIEFQMNEKINLYIQPNAELQFLQLVEDSFTGARFYAYGVKTGISFNL